MFAIINTIRTAINNARVGRDWAAAAVRAAQDRNAANFEGGTYLGRNLIWAETREGAVDISDARKIMARQGRSKKMVAVAHFDAATV